MNKKKFVVLALLMIAVITLSSCMLVACNNDTEDDASSSTSTVTETEGLLIKNGDFKVIDTASTTYPRSITSWTGAKMYSSGDYKSDVTAGAISLDKALYDANKSKWGDDNDELYNKLVANGRYDNDDVKNALMVYMPVEGKDEDDKTINGPTAYGYTSTSFTLDKGSYYKLSVDVLTYNIAGNDEDARGARIYLSSNTYAEFDGIDTNGEWKTYEIVIESSPTASTSLSVLLGLGKCTASSDAGLTTGYAFFDNLSLVKIEDTDDTTAQSVYEDALADELNKVDNVTTATLKVPNGRFDFGTTTISSSGTPNSWSLTSGNSGKDDPAPTAPRHNGIVDLNQLVKDITDNNLSSYSPLYKTKGSADEALADYYPANGLINLSNLFTEERANSIVGSNVFMLSQQLLTAQGIKSSRTITIERNKTYALSIDLYTYGIHGAGVSLILTGSDGKDITIKGISSHTSNDYLIGDTKITVGDTTGYTNGTEEGATTGGWTTYTFYIKGNQFRNYSYNMEIWLGTDGTNANTSATYHSYTSNTDSAVIYRADGTFSNGWVFIDELKLTESTLPAAGDKNVVADDTYTLDCSATDLASKTGIIVDLTSDNTMFENIFNNTTGKSSMDGVVASTTQGAPTGWTSNYDTTNSSNPVITNLITDGVVSLVDEEAYLASGGIGTYPDMPYAIDTKLAYMINSSADSYYEVETTPMTIKANNYYRISMWVKTQDIKSTSGAYIYVLQKNEGEDDTTLATFSKINTADYDEYQNDWCELTVIVAGSDKADTTISFKFTLGTGTRWTSSTLATGSMFIANVNGGNISHSTYSGTSTGTYVKAIDLKTTNSYAFSNGGFDSYDVDDENLDENKGLGEQTVAASPSNWTISDSKLNANTDESNLVAGIIKFNTTDNLNFTASAQATSAFAGNVNFDGFYPTIDSNSSLDGLNSLPGSKGHVLAIGNNSASSTGYAVGFASSSITLSANTYYRISFYARTYGATKATAYLTGESSLTTGVSSFTIESTDSMGWTKYTFYIEVGQTSVSTKLNLWLGENIDYADITVTDEEVSNAKSSNAEYADMTDAEVKTALKTQKASSTGNVFYDNVYYTSIDEADYDKAVEGNEVHKLSFLTDSFDALSSTVDSRASLSTPNGWTGAVGSNQSSSNTKSGVVYADHNFYEVQTVNGVEYARILGKEYKLDDMTYSDKEIDEYISLHPEYTDKRDDAAKKVQENKLAEKQAGNWIPTSVLKAHSGNQMLVINNTENSAYTYTSSSVTLKENSYYEVSVFVKTYGIGGKDDDDTIGANIELYLGSANETDNPFSFNAIKHDEYTEYKFYVKTQDDDVTSVTVKLSLGKYVSEEVDGESVVSGLTSGYALFDDVTITKIDETAFDSATESDFVLKREVATETKGEGDEDEDDTTNETPDSTFNTEALWWMIPTIVLGLLIIIVVVVFVVRKVRKPIVKKKEKKVATPQETPSLDAKRDKYDDNKE